jgi:hypothetical protein
MRIPNFTREPLKKTCKYSVLILVLFLFYAPHTFGQGNLLIYPKRLVFEGTQKRVQLLNLTNTGKDSATYRISYVEIKMTDDGQREYLSEPEEGQRFATPFLRVFPRTVTLAPNKSQQVKIQLIKASSLEPGEYRSHLYLRAVPKDKKLEKKNETDNENTGLSISLTPVFGYTIANIIKIGEPNIQVELSNLAVADREKNFPELSFNINRKGNMSPYGDFSVWHISPKGVETIVGSIKGISVYVPGTYRKLRIKLNNPKEINFNEGELRIVYASSAGKTIYTETSFKL